MKENQIHMSKTTKHHLALFAGILACVFQAASSQGATITFESPYTLGNLTSGPTGATNRPFTGQQGWSQSTSAGLGTIQTTTSSGLYVGGQALSGGTSGYIGGLVGAPTINTISFDFMRTANEKAGVGRWDDVDVDGLFDQAEVGAYVGTNTAGQFNIRAANFGADNSTGILAVASTWYHIVGTYDDATLTLTMDVTDLTNGGVPIDLNGGAAGNSFAVTFGTAAAYGSTLAAADGIFARATFNTMFVDNITIPEPSTYALMAGGLLLLLAVRRKRGLVGAVAW